MIIFPLSPQGLVIWPIIIQGLNMGTQHSYMGRAIGVVWAIRSLYQHSHKMLGDLRYRRLKFYPHLKFFMGIYIEVLLEVDGGEISFANELII